MTDNLVDAPVAVGLCVLDITGESADDIAGQMSAIGR